LRRALIVVDVQQGFEDSSWGRRDEPAAEANIATLLADWRECGHPIVIVRHDSTQQGSPLAPGQAGNDLHPLIDTTADLFGTKTVNSAFDGLDGEVIDAELIKRVTAANLQGEFADVVTTVQALEHP
jgi:nicotinamidase-related amidase